ncbi:unnamed protein product [Haemonchus placei]|uniref:26S proteasome non-ATPase regulatory subunit 4 n=1 Tax=Haemonchus placei TaxID=6290 RepID=A0A0N4WLC1_HAEPC|nr:unnamed protein product [Haemonchus placei]
MLTRTILSSRLLRLASGKPLQFERNTWILRRVYAPDPTPPGRVQRNPEELPNLMKLEVVEIETSKKAGPLKVILLQDVEGVGHQFDVVDVDRKLARTDLLPSRKAEMADELAKRVRIPYEYICIGRDLQALVVPIKVSMDNKWTIDKQIVKISLMQMGVDMLDDSIFLDDNTISGPNFEIEAKLIRFYVVVCKQYIVPMLGRISHISVDETKQMLIPEKSQTPTADLLARYGIKPEEPYYHPAADVDENFPVVDFMRNKARSPYQKWAAVLISKMVQESTMIWYVICEGIVVLMLADPVLVVNNTCFSVDNSEWMRNGDFVPTRLQCQQDAANLILQCKLRANPENAVGLLSMAKYGFHLIGIALFFLIGLSEFPLRQVQVLSTMTQEAGRLFMKLHQLEPQGICNFMSAIKIAHLALKHRQNRNHKMRIVMFIGSPIDNLDSAELTKIAKKLKKEKVQCDVICFGEADSENSQIMGQFVDTLNGKEGSGSNLLVVPAGSVLTEALISSAVCRGEDGGNAPVVGAGGGFEFGVDPEDDPDLALALRVSMEEERARQAAEAAAAAAASGNAPAEPAAGTEQAQNVDVMDMEMGEMTEEQQLEWALRMSMQDSVPGFSKENVRPKGLIITCSLLAPTAQPSQAQPTDEVMDVSTAQVDNLDELINNPELLQQIIDDLPGGEKKNDEKKPKNEEK